MPAVAQILIEVDETGAVNSLNSLAKEEQKLGPAFEKTGKQSNVVLTQMTRQHEQAREAAQLLSNTLGVQVPRSLEKVLASSKVIGPALAEAFNVAVIGSFAAVAIQTLLSVAEAFHEVENAAKNMRLEAFKSASDSEISLLQQQQVVARDLQVRAATATANELIKLDAKYHTERRALEDAAITAEMDARRTGETDVVKLINDNLLALDKAHEAEKKALLLQETADIRNAKDQEVAANKRGVDRIVADEKTAMDQINASVVAGKTLVAVGEAEKAAIHAQTLFKEGEADEAYEELRKNLADREGLADLQAQANALAGKAALDQEYLLKKKQIDVAEHEFQRQLEAMGIHEIVTFNVERLAAEKDYNTKVADLARQRADEETQISTEAAIASLPPWQRADAQIVASTVDRINKIRELEAKDGNFREQGEREVGLIIQKEWHDRVDSMANQLETLYNDITSGGIGKFFLERFKKLVFEMVAQWIVGMGTMRAATQSQMGSGGGFLGAIFGALGIGGGGAIGGGGQGGIGGLPGVITNFSNFFGGGTSTALGGGVMAGAPASDIGSVLGPIIGLSGGMGTSTVGPLPSGSSTGAANSGLAAIFGKLFPGSSAADGGLGTMLATLGIGVAIDGIRRHGVLGALEGAGGGALTGFEIGGPPGAVIGAIVGALASIIGGLFGPHTGDTARIQVMEPLLASIKQVTDSYDVFQTDYNTGVSELETLRTNALAALRKIGGHQVSGNSAATNQRVDAAEQHLKDTEAERQRRAQLTFGPPQFRYGGFVGGELASPAPAWFPSNAMRFASGGAVPAILHEGEFVMRPEAVNRIGRGTLASMNAGGGAATVHNHYYNINALDAKSVAQLFRRMQLEGAW